MSRDTRERCPEYSQHGVSLLASHVTVIVNVWARADDSVRASPSRGLRKLRLW